VRTALFNILGTWLKDARVLDAYAGAGAIGFECLSRGVAEVTFIEQRATAVAALQNNARLLAVEHAVRIVANDVLKALPLLRGRHVDLIYADPPYRDLNLPVLLGALRDADVAHDESVLVLEHASAAGINQDAACCGWRAYRCARYGVTQLSFFAFDKVSA
jgi:16S rRNA (guanine(966)-N(2))-methyltransferase RsmD